MTTLYIANIPDNTNLSFLSNSFVDDVVVFHDLLLDGIRQILQTSLFLLQIYIAQSSIEKYFARVEFEEEAKLGIVDHAVTSQIQQRIVKVGQGLFEIAQQKI